MDGGEQGNAGCSYGALTLGLAMFRHSFQFSLASGASFQPMTKGSEPVTVNNTAG